MSEATRRFLTPLVGVDPVSVRVYQGEQATRLAAAFDADALSVGEDIVLGAGHAPDAPETRGLLAHELTHVARQRTPRFVPPVVRVESDQRGAEPAASLPSRDVDGLDGEDEERLARRVEARVARAARAEQAHLTSARSDDDGVAPDGHHSDGHAGYAGPTPPADGTRQSAWGGLPAPWEPLPSWLARPAVATSGPETYGPATGAAPLMNGQLGSGATPMAAAPSVVHLAARGGGDAEAAAPAPSSAPHPPAAPVEPDLDALARSVYTILQRRLSAEYRRAR